MFLSKYKNILGVPGKGFHAQRIPYLGYAQWDTVGTIGITCVLVVLFARDKSPGNTIRWIVFAFSLGLLLHLVFGVRTKMVRDLYGQFD
jgi:hypothetical protein